MHGAATARRRPKSASLALSLGFAAALAYGVWILSPRFGLASPAVIDDWNGASQRGQSLGALIEPFFSAPAQRFRPGFGLFDQLEWHTLGAPDDLTGPNIWNLLRLALFVAAVGLIPAWAARAVRPGLPAPALAALAALPPAAVLTSPTIAVDFARLAPQEPMLIGATLCGAALIVLGLDRWIGGARGWPLLLAGGVPLYLLGVFHKEASMAFLVVVPALYVVLAARWRERGAFDGLREGLRDPRVLGVGALLTLPLLWVAFRSATIGGEGADLYGAGQPSGLSGWVDRLRSALRLQWDNLPVGTGGNLWRGIAVALPFLAVAVWVDRRRVPWLSIGIGLAALLMLIIQGLPGAVVSRYLIPTVALLAVAASLLLVQARAWLLWAALGATALFVIQGATGAHDAVDAWASDEEASEQFISRVADLTEAGCPLYSTGLDIERSESFPRLVALALDRRPGGRRCPLPEEAIVVSLTTSTGPTSSGVWSACRSEWRRAFGSGIWIAWGCAELQSPRGRAILEPARLVPGVPQATRQACLDGRFNALADCDGPLLTPLDPDETTPPARPDPAAAQ